MEKNKPMGKKILYVDDNLEFGKSTLEGTDLEFVAKMPDELDKDSAVLDALRGIDVVLMDYDLHEDDTASSAPIDGIELLERFRAAIRTLQKAENLIPLLTIYTGKYDKLVKELNCPSAPYLVARRANVDWVFAKGNARKGTEITACRLKSILSGFELNLSSTELMMRINYSRSLRCRMTCCGLDWPGNKFMTLDRQFKPCGVELTEPL